MKLVVKILIAVFCAVLPLASRADTVLTNLTVEAMTSALANGGLITFTNVGTNATLVLKGTNLVVLTNTTIDGAGLGLTFSGNTGTNADTVHSRVFFVTNNVTLTLANLSIINGRTTNGAGIFVASNAVVNITNCTLMGNNAFGGDGKNGNNASGNGNDGGNGGPGTNGIGGAIYNLGTVNIQNSLISSNKALGGNGGDGGRGGNDSSFGGDGGNGGAGAISWGGAIYNAGTLLINNSTLTNNYVWGGFGGFAGFGGTAPFPGHPGRGGAGAAGYGGGVYNLGTATITNSTLVINAAKGGDSEHAGVDEDGRVGGPGAGGGVYNLGTLFIGNCTFTENSAEGGKGGDVFSGNFVEGGNGGGARGGAILNSNALTIVSSTLATNNSIGGPPGINPIAGQNGSAGANLGGNIYRGSGSVVVRNTILSKGTSGKNFDGSTVGIDGGYNLSSDTSCNFTATGSRNNTNAFLASLANNGGPTATMALRTNSPAIDKGDPIFNDGFDQRGISRPQGTNSDIGAFELVPTFSISGKIFEGTNGVSNIVVTAGTFSATSQTNGVYTIYGLPPTNYVVTPTPVGAGFTPLSTNVSVGTNITASGNVTNVNFFANRATISNPTITFTSTNQNRTNAIFTMQFIGMPQRSYRIQASTNLSSTNWKNISTNFSTTNGLFQFSQTNLSTNAQRFFRLVIP